MSKGGYDKFFKEAQKASGLSKAPTKSVRSAQQQAAAAAAGSRFTLKKPAKQDTPEDRIRAELALRMKNKKIASRKKKAKFPVFAAICAVFALCASLVGFFQADLAEEYAQKFLSRFEIGVFGNAQASEKAKGGEKSAAPKSAEPAKAADTHEPVKHAEGGAQAKWSAEDVSFFGKLNERKKELDLKESELAKLEEELLKRKQELDEKLKQLETMRADISKTLKVRVASDHEKVDKLVAVYSTMKPAQASKIIETLDEDLAVEILDNMKKKSAAEILNMMDAKKARKLSELLTGYERSTASTQKADEKEKEE